MSEFQPTATTNCSHCGEPVEKGKFPDHKKVCKRPTKTCDAHASCAKTGGDSAVGTVKPNVCRDCEHPLTGPYSEHKAKCPFQIAKAKETPPQMSKDGNGKSCDNAPSKGPEKSDPVAPSGGKGKALKGSEKSDAVAHSGGGGKSPKDASHAAPVGGGGGKGHKGSDKTASSSVAPIGGGGGKGQKSSEKSIASVSTNEPIRSDLLGQYIGSIRHDCTFTNGSNATFTSFMCGHLLNPPHYTCNVSTCTGKLIKTGGFCYITKTRKMIGIVVPKTTGNDSTASWRDPTKDEISLFKMPDVVASSVTVAAADV